MAWIDSQLKTIHFVLVLVWSSLLVIVTINLFFKNPSAPPSQSFVSLCQWVLRGDASESTTSISRLYICYELEGVCCLKRSRSRNEPMGKAEVDPNQCTPLHRLQQHLSNVKGLSAFRQCRIVANELHDEIRLDYRTLLLLKACFAAAFCREVPGDTRFAVARLWWPNIQTWTWSSID